MRDKIILTDVDGTIVDFAHPFHDWMDARNYKVINDNHLTRTFLIPEVFDCTQEEYRKEVKAFSESEAFRNLPPLPGAQEAIESFRHDGWAIIAITSCHVSEASVEARCHNLKSLFGFDEKEVIFAGALASKLDILQSYPRGYWIDDVHHHVVEGYMAGHHPIIYDRPYNRIQEDGQRHEVDDYAVRLTNWFEIESFIRGYHFINYGVI